MSSSLRSGSKTGDIEKNHLIINRVLRDEAIQKGTPWLDMGTDHHYPFFKDYPPTEAAMASFGQHQSSILHYPSSYGLTTLRQEFSDFMEKQFNISLDPHREIMVNTGASQSFDAISRSFTGRYVALPDLSLPTVSTIAVGNGAQGLRLPSDPKTGFINLEKAAEVLRALPENSVRFLYLNSPCNPTGEIASFDYLQELVAFGIKNKILIFHDMDSWYTTHEDGLTAKNILQVPGAKECCITVLSISKEFGLPGLRVGFLAGNETVIDIIREHNSVFCVMIPEICQFAAEAAFKAYDPERDKPEINNRVTKILDLSLDLWTSLGWPEDQLKRPKGGFKYLIPVPPNIPKKMGPFTGIELLDFFITRRCAVKLSSSRSFNPEDDRYIRIIVMQEEDNVIEAFSRMKAAGINYNMSLPDGIVEEYSDFLGQNIDKDF